MENYQPCSIIIGLCKRISTLKVVEFDKVFSHAQYVKRDERGNHGDLLSRMTITNYDTSSMNIKIVGKIGYRVVVLGAALTGRR